MTVVLFIVIMLNIVMLNAVMLNGVQPSVVILSVVAPFKKSVAKTYNLICLFWDKGILEDTLRETEREKESE